MCKIVTLAAFVAALLLAPACAHAQIGQIDGRITSTFGGEIDTSSKANGYVLTYQSSSGKWIASATGTPSLTLDDLTDVTITTAASGNVLRFNGSSWVNATTSTVLDTIGSTRGSVLYRGASGWAALVPGTSGHVLTCNGSGADPSWAAAAGGSFNPSAAVDITFGGTGGTIYGNTVGSGVSFDGNTDGGGSQGCQITMAAGASGVGASFYVSCSSAATSSGADGGAVEISLGNKDGAGAPGFFTIHPAASAAVLFKVAYDGTLSFMNNSTGAQTATLGTNGPMVTTTPYTWQKVTTSDGSVGYVPIWK